MREACSLRGRQSCLKAGGRLSKSRRKTTGMGTKGDRETIEQAMVGAGPVGVGRGKHVQSWRIGSPRRARNACRTILKRWAALQSRSILCVCEGEGRRRREGMWVTMKRLTWLRLDWVQPI